VGGFNILIISDVKIEVEKEHYNTLEAVMAAGQSEMFSIRRLGRLGSPTRSLETDNNEVLPKFITADLPASSSSKHHLHHHSASR
jgi:hypothetical protein